MVELIKNTVNNNSKVVNTLQKTIYSTTFRNQTPLILETSLTLALNVSGMVFHMSEFPCVCVWGGGGVDSVLLSSVLLNSKIISNHMYCN